MPEFLTLEEAARLLGMSPDELKAKAQHREIRAFQDGGSWQFRKFDIEEEARRRGLGSDPELSLSDLDLPTPPPEGSSEHDLLTEFQIGVVPPDLAPDSVEMKSESGSGEQDILLDDRNVPLSATGSSSTIIGMQPAPGKLPSDSDVKLVPDNLLKGASDSDVRLSPPGYNDLDVTLDTSDSLSSASQIHPVGPTDPNATLYQPPILGSSDEVRIGGESDSDFELTPSSVMDALEPESGSEFELTALDASSDEVASVSPAPSPSDSDVTGAGPDASGVNLGRPSDSGINLQSVGGSFDFGTADSIELAPLDDEPEAPSRPAPPTPQPKKEDLSATAVPMRADKDIFEDTDFEVDAIDGDSSSEDQTVQLEAASDFDVEDSESSASEVFALDEEGVDSNAATSMAPAVVADESGEFSASEEDESESAWDIDEPTPSQARAVAPMLAPSGAAPEWGGLWVGVLSVATVLMLLLAFVGMDMVRNLYSFQGDGPASGLVKVLAGLGGGG